MLSAGILAAAESAGVKFMRGTPCTALVSRTADDGTVEILGCVAKKGSKTIRIRAKKAVVMATGGFDWNQQMMKSYLRTPARHSWGCSTDTGDGHKMAMRVGADMNMMSEGWLSPGYKKEFDESRAAEASNLSSLIMDDAKRGIIFVNKHGKRFTNECANYDSVGRSFCAIENDGEERGWKNLPAFAIIDQAAADNHTFNKGELGKPGKSFTRFETLEELADACGIDKQSLLAEVSRYNENAEMGLDPDFQRGQDYYAQQSTYSSKGFEGAARTLAPLTTPLFLATILSGGRLGGQDGRPRRGRTRVAGSSRRFRPTVSRRLPPPSRSADAAIAADSGRSTGRRPRIARIRRAPAADSRMRGGPGAAHPGSSASGAAHAAAGATPSPEPRPSPARRTRPPGSAPSTSRGPARPRRAWPRSAAPRAPRRSNGGVARSGPSTAAEAASPRAAAPGPAGLASTARAFPMDAARPASAALRSERPASPRRSTPVRAPSRRPAATGSPRRSA